MGKIYSARITDTDPEIRANMINNFFDQLDGISAEIDEEVLSDLNYHMSTITIDGTDVVAKYGISSSTSTRRTALKVIDGSKTLIPNSDAYAIQYYGTNDYVDVKAYIDEKMVLLYINEPSASMENSNGFELIYLKDVNGNKNLIGYVQLLAATNIYLYDIGTNLFYFEDESDNARIKYTYTNMFPYVAIGGTIDFLAQSYFVNSGIRKFQSNFLRECSTITIGSTASLPDGNYIAIGTHCLAPLDEEEEVNE